MVDPDPVLDMKGMTMEDITLLLKFIYTGEVVIEKRNVEQFLEAANELKIAGLTKANKSETEDSDSKQTSDEKMDSVEPDKKKLKAERKKERRSQTTTQLNSASYEMGSNECDICGAEHKSGKAFMKHRQAEHPGQNFKCKECGKELASNNNLKIHRRAIHTLVKYPCGTCGNQFTNKSNLNFHMKKMHAFKKEFDGDALDNSTLDDATKENDSLQESDESIEDITESDNVNEVLQEDGEDEDEVIIEEVPENEVEEVE